MVTVLITPRITTHEPPSKPSYHVKSPDLEAAGGQTRWAAELPRGLGFRVLGEALGIELGIREVTSCLK